MIRRYFVHNGRLRSVWRVLTFLLANTLLQLLLSVFLIIALGFYLSLRGVPAGELASRASDLLTAPGGLILVLSVQLTATIAVAYLWRHWLDKRSFRSLGLVLSAGWWKELCLGLAVGAFVWLAIFALALVTSAASIASLRLDFKQVASALLAGMILGLLTGLNEELEFRGYVMGNLVEGIRLFPATLVSSLVFGAAHLLNPGASLTSTVGVALAGVLFGLAYAATGRLWMPIGMHAAWNFFEGPLLGFPVSGLHLPSVVELQINGPEWLTGGAFGPEAGALTIVPLLGLIALFFYWAFRGPQPASG